MQLCLEGQSWTQNPVPGVGCTTVRGGARRSIANPCGPVGVRRLTRDAATFARLCYLGPPRTLAGQMLADLECVRPLRATRTHLARACAVCFVRIVLIEQG